MRVIQFESIVNGGLIRIPDEYKDFVSSVVNVTLVPATQERPRFKPKTKEWPDSIDEFPAVLDTKGWKWDKDEANER